MVNEQSNAIPDPTDVSAEVEERLAQPSRRRRRSPALLAMATTFAVVMAVAFIAMVLGYDAGLQVMLISAACTLIFILLESFAEFLSWN